MKLIRWCASIFAFATSCVGAFASEIVDVTYVTAAAKRGAIIWDMRSAQDYAQGHVPGAVNLSNSASILRNPNTEDFLDVSVVGKLLNAAGLDLSKEIITYSNRGDWQPYWGQIVIRHFGGTPGKVFHGGIEEWSAAGLTVATQPTVLAPLQKRHKINPTVQISMPEVLKKVRNSRVQFLDVRTPSEFSGDDIRALRGGHIPGAINIPYQQNWIDPDTDVKLANGFVKTRDGMTLKPLAELKQLYAAIDPSKETIVYCQSGGRASVTALLLRELGYKNVRVFEESWLGYGNNVSAPAESVQFFNINALNGKVKGLESNVQMLLKEIKDLRATKP